MNINRWSNIIVLVVMVTVTRILGQKTVHVLCRLQKGVYLDGVSTKTIVDNNIKRLI